MRVLSATAPAFVTIVMITTAPPPCSPPSRWPPQSSPSASRRSSSWAWSSSSSSTPFSPSSNTGRGTTMIFPPVVSSTHKLMTQVSRILFFLHMFLFPGVIAPLAWEEGEPLSRSESRMSRIVRVRDKSKQYLHPLCKGSLFRERKNIMRSLNFFRQYCVWKLFFGEIAEKLFFPF